ncbi:RNA polymerase sigma factor [Limnobacter litoralis]|uniref:RNA polymerase sigma factor n=1 Tax=Limnobacter litoralis TaxID=481366 RepID=A0ABQ5YNV6_9BURK|nr:sigma-70 family RNA polymerase sigma factor [Limnobacter litoralis]GLR25797.1 RNA polymerase sigma factor [Limnobacter litoralis]
MTDHTQAKIQIHFKAESSFQTLANAPVIESLKSLEQLLLAQRSRLTHFIRKHLKRDESVEDVLQQTHMAAFRSWERFRGESKPETWLFGIAMNLIRNARARDTHSSWMVDDAEEQLLNIPTEPCDEPIELLQRAQQMELLREAICNLPARMQAAVHLVFLEGLSYQDAAEELNLPIGTIRSRLSRARDLLRTNFDI